MGDSLWQRLIGGTRHLRQQPEWERFAGPGWAERIMALPVTDRFHAKQGRSIGRLRLHADDKQLVVYLKRHYRLSWWRGLLATLWPEANWSPALQEWDHLEWARAQGLPVPKALACGQYLLPGARLQSFLAVEELTDMLPLHEAVPLARRRQSPSRFAFWKRGLVGEMARLTRALHDRRAFHKDLYLCHFYISEANTVQPVEDWTGKVHLIDLHRLAQHRWTWPWWQAKDLGQLLYSSHIEGVTDQDRLRFWKLYLRGGARGGILPLSSRARSGLLQRWVRWIVQLRARNYLGRNRRKPQVPSESPTR